VAKFQELSFRYGSGAVGLSVPSHYLCETLLPRSIPALADPISAIRAALAQPIGVPSLRNTLRPGERVAIIVNDITRLVHSEVFLPILIGEINAVGIPDRDIFIVFALGLHRAQSAEERSRIVGEEIARRIALFDHDCRTRENLVLLGRTNRGNEVWINRRVHEADRVVLTGEIIYHQIAGYSGGRKSLVPGVAGADTINFNHRLILEPNCRPGLLEGNPAHEDLLEACRLFDPDFLLNVVLSPSGEWVRVVAGHYDLAHRAGCETVDQLCRAPVSEAYDVVLASAGGFPLDIDLRQAHKGMENAARALRSGGVLIYFAECAEGTGSKLIEEWVENYSDAREMERELRSRFVVGAHKAYWLARLGDRVKVLLVSRLPEDLVRKCHLHPLSDPQNAIAGELRRLGAGARIAYIPYAGIALPQPADDQAVAAWVQTSVNA
jgi:nickel-dependent lactate racemase